MFARLMMWVVLTIQLTLDHRSDLGTYIPGDPGDSYLVLSLLQWGADRSTELFAGFWSGPMFAGAGDAMAYSETFLVLTVPFKVLEVLTGSPVIAFNVLYVLGWVLCGEATFALASRMLRSRSAALVVAVAFTFSTVRVSVSNHFQLVWAGLIPLSFLVLFRYWDRPSPRRAAVVAAVVLAQVLSSAYYGVIVVIVVGAAMGLRAVIAAARERTYEPLLAALPFFVLVGLPMLYLQQKYASADDGVLPRPDYPGPFVSRLGDLRAPPPTTRFLDSIGFLAGESANRSPENHAYVGLLVLVGLPLLAVLLGTRFRRMLARARPLREWGVALGAGVLSLAIALGRSTIAGVELPFYDVARALLPGIADMVALGRLVVFTQLALVLGAGLALVVVLEHLPRRSARVALCTGLVAVVALEAAMHHPMVGVIEPRPGSVNAILEQRGEEVVVLLPMPPLSAGIIQPFIEAPRMVLGADDDLRSVNGYSGYAPRSYDATVEAMNDFPDTSSIDAIRRLGVDLVVIYTEGFQIPGTEVDDAVNASGFAFWPREEAERRIAEAPTGLIQARHDGTDGIVLEVDAHGG